MAVTRDLFRTRKGMSEGAVVLSLCGVVVLLLTIVKLRYVQIFQGDTAMFFQMMHNLLHTGLPTSQIGADIQAYLGAFHLQKMPASAIAAAPLAPPAIDTVNMLSWHAYYVYYLLAPFCAIFPIPVVLLASFVVSFAGLLGVLYFFVRSRGVSVVEAIGLVLLVVCHPAWWASLLWGQFYPDRIFVFAEFTLMVLISLPRAPRWAIAACAVLAASITERAPLVAGITMLLYVVLFWKQSSADRRFKIVFALAAIVYGVLMVKIFIHNPYNSHYFRSSMPRLVMMFTSYPYFTARIALMFLASAPLLLLAGFEWRALAIALVAMAPNVFGNDGGSEKVGWITHYASYYLPVVVWAAAMGLSSYAQRGSARQKRYVVAGMGIALVMLAFLDPFSFAPIRFVAPGPGSSMLPATIESVRKSLGPPGAASLADGSSLAKAIPPGSSVSSVEAGMPYVYQGNVVHLFPIGIDGANYAIVKESVDADDRRTYSGMASSLGVSETARIDEALLARMRLHGYDMAHPIEFPVLGLAVFRRS